MAETDKRVKACTAPKEEGEAGQEVLNHPLEHKWTLWYDAGSSGKQGTDTWGTTLKSNVHLRLCGRFLVVKR